MANLGFNTILGPEDYQNYFHTESSGNIWVDEKGNPITLQRKLTGHKDTISPETLWQSRQTRQKTHQPTPTPQSKVPNSTMVDPNNQGKLDQLPCSPITNKPGPSTVQDDITAKTVDCLLNLATGPNATPELKSFLHKGFGELLAKIEGNDIGPVDLDDPNNFNKQLTDKDMALKAKDSEIEMLRNDLVTIRTDLQNSMHMTKQLTNMKESLSQTHQQHLAQQQREFQRQLNTLKEQKQTETLNLQRQVSQLTAQVQTQKQHLDTFSFPPPPPPLAPQPYYFPNNSTLDGSLIEQLSTSLNNQTLVNTQHYLNMAPSYDGKDPKQFYTWLDEISRLSSQYNLPEIKVAENTSRGSVHRYINEMGRQNMHWDLIKIKLRERFSDCSSSAAAQNKLSSLKQDSKSMHEYITHFTDLLEHAHGVNPSNPSTKLLANQFIEGIDDSNKYIKNKLREKCGTNLDYYFQEAMNLQHKQEIRAIDFGTNIHTNVRHITSDCTDINEHY